jgi:hypothetical protein
MAAVSRQAGPPGAITATPNDEARPIIDVGPARAYST